MKHASIALVLAMSSLLFACQKSEMPGPAAPKGQGGSPQLSSGIRPAPQLRKQPTARIIDNQTALNACALLEKWQAARPNRYTDSLPEKRQKH